MNKDVPLLQGPDFYHEADLFRDGGQIVLMQELRQCAARRHRHDFAELVLVLSGTARHETAAGVSQLGTGDFFALEGRQYHAYQEPKGFHLINILIRCADMERKRDALREMSGYAQLFSENGECFVQPRRLLAQELVELTQLARQIGREVTGGREGRALVLDSLLTQLLATACRLAASASQHQGRGDEVGRVMQFLDEHYQEPIYLEQLEALSFLTGRSLQRRFKQILGVSPMQYLLRVRLTCAARLLRETDNKLWEIAELTGFNDEAYFLRQFREETGITPGEYRRRVSEGLPCIR